MTVENRHDWEIAFRGLERFFDEGMTLWPKDKFFLLFPNETVANGSYVLEQLINLEKQGAISFVGTDELYIKVLNI
ncbi:hypothetical protein [Pseudomonas sp. Q11]|uniref:hypothetical protein n=1 Tax=Pseudomonas sp. Q11 TaxID=2968470 RepID=UPI00210BA9D0|nr:hypothetical protein [Pseudomonas sp. Q11]MCQ6260258.1 hypothetical protein [Pseudomonas sp. Q11]